MRLHRYTIFLLAFPLLSIGQKSRSDGSSSFSNISITNSAKNGNCYSINIIGNGNVVTVPEDYINAQMKDGFNRFAKLQNARQDRRYAQLMAMLEQIKTLVEPDKLLALQSRANKTLDTLTDTYLPNTSQYAEAKRNILNNYQTIEPLAANKGKVMLTKIDGKNYYIADNIHITPEDLLIFEKNKFLTRYKFLNKYGYLDQNGNILVAPKYDSACDISGTYALAVKDGLYWELIDSTGKTIQRMNVPEFEEVHPVSSGAILVKKKTTEGKPGYYFLDIAGKVIAGPFHFATDFSYGLAGVADIVPDPFLLRYLDLHPDGFSPFLHYYLDALKLIDPGYSRRLATACNRYFAIRKKWPKGRNFPSADSIPLLTDEPAFLSEDYPLLSTRLISRYIDSTGKPAMPDTFLIAEPYDEKTAARVCLLTPSPKDPDLCFGVIDRQGRRKGHNVFYPLLFDSAQDHTFPISSFRSGLATVDDKIIDTAGEVLQKLATGYQFSGYPVNGIFTICNKNTDGFPDRSDQDATNYKTLPADPKMQNDYSIYRYGLINSNGIYVLPVVYKKIVLVNPYLARTEGFDQVIQFFNINPNGKSLALKPVEVK